MGLPFLHRSPSSLKNKNSGWKRGLCSWGREQHIVQSGQQRESAEGERAQRPDFQGGHFLACWFPEEPHFFIKLTHPLKSISVITSDFGLFIVYSHFDPFHVLWPVSCPLTCFVSFDPALPKALLLPLLGPLRSSFSHFLPTAPISLPSTAALQSPVLDQWLTVFYPSPVLPAAGGKSLWTNMLMSVCMCPSPAVPLRCFVTRFHVLMLLSLLFSTATIPAL